MSRRTARSTAGVPPNRLGINVEVTMSDKEKEQSTGTGEDSSSGTVGPHDISIVSSAGNTPQDGVDKSNASDIRSPASQPSIAGSTALQRIALKNKTKKKIHELEQQLAKSVKQFELARNELHRMELSLAKTRKEIDVENLDPVAKEDLLHQKEHLKQAIEEKRVDLRSFEILLKFDEPDIRRQIEILEGEEEERLLELDEEAERDKKEDSVDKRSSTERWAKEAANQTVIQNKDFDPTAMARIPSSQPIHPPVQNIQAQSIDKVQTDSTEDTTGMVRFNGVMMTPEDVAMLKVLDGWNGVVRDAEGNVISKENNPIPTRPKVPQPNVYQPFDPLNGFQGSGQGNTQTQHINHQHQSSQSHIPPGGQNSDPMVGSVTGTELVSAITEAFRLVQGSSTSSGIENTRTLLSRQVQGRDLPVFHGSPEEWPSFIAAFANSTNNCRYTHADNLSRLQKSLKGEALKMVQWLLISPDNVPAILDELKTRYGNPEVIIKSLIMRAKNVPAVKMDKMETFLEFGIMVKNLAATITGLGRMDHLSNPSLLDELVVKLPNQKQMEWIKWKNSRSAVPDIQIFANWLSSETRAAYEMCPASSVPVSKEKKSNGRVQITQEKKSDSKSDNKFNKKCSICNKPGHKAWTCSFFMKKRNSEKYELVKDKKLCFCCLNQGHSVRDCRRKKICGEKVDDEHICQNIHHPLLHRAPRVKESNEKVLNSAVEPNSLSSDEDFQHSVHAAKPERISINVGILPVILKGPNGTIKVYAELDNGATISVIDAGLATSLGLKGKVTPLKVNGFQSVTHLDRSEAIEMEIFSSDGRNSQRVKVRTVPQLQLSPQSVRRSTLRKWKHLADIPISTYENAKPQVLIGLDNAKLLTPREVKSGKGNAPYATRTLLGWVLMGPVAGECSRNRNCFRMNCEEDPLHQLVKDQFSTEAFGTVPMFEKPRSREDVGAQMTLDQTVRKTDNGWETGLLWKDANPQLPPSKASALKRLLTMERKMDRDPEFARAYEAKIKEYLDKGYARYLSKEEIEIQTPKTYYLPHFMAYNPKKPSKLRFVFDAAAKSYGSSLNDHLLQGPDKMTSLPGCIMKFRQRQIAISADIQDMFHRVKVRPEDAAAQRFLWRGMNRSQQPSILQMDVLIFGATCSPCCATEVKNRNALQHKEEFPSAYDAIVHRHYVDDLLDSVDSEEEAIRRFQEVCEVHRRGNFRICNWISNSPTVLKAIPKDLLSNSLQNMDMLKNYTTSDVEGPKCDQMERVLGLFWKPEDDQFTFSLNFIKANEEILTGQKVPTKRQMLSLVMSLYDPLGFVSSLSIKARMILQSTWRTNMEWNDEISSELHQRWKQWLNMLSKITKFRLDRCYLSGFSTSRHIELHIFCDASEEAFGAVGYFRICQNDEIKTALVMSRAKVAPMKALSIPRLELQAAVLGSRMAKFIHQEHEVKIHRTIFWTDSSSVLSWIRADSRRFQQFVSHRIGEIQELTDINQWRWVPTEDNVSDEMTRFDRPCDLSKNSRWLNGPAFLKEEEDKWPTESRKREVDTSKLEMKPFVMRMQQAKEDLIDITRFSTWRKLIRTTGYVFRFISHCFPKSSRNVSSRILDLEELSRAMQYWWKKSQEDSFPEELVTTRKGQSLAKSSKLYTLCPYLDEIGLLRVRGRLENATVLSDTTRRPIILSPKHLVTKMIVMDFHVQFGHHGFDRIMNEIRQHFFIFNLRALVKKVKQECQQCRNATAKPIVPIMGQLPRSRLTGLLPFAQTGMDYFGPITVVVKRSREKRYGVIFTCLASRAIHLEVANSLSADSCILAIRRFVNRRGTPLEIHSDNGTNFHGAANELREALKELDDNKIKEDCVKMGFQWNFIPPAAPHMGGSWERMVQSVKKALGTALDLKNLSDESLYSFLVEAEHTVNSHPLTHVSDDPDDPEALTPNHFLIHRSSNKQPMGHFTKTELFGRKQWRAVQHLADCFWRRWVKEYLPTLLRRTKWCQSTKAIAIGDVVLEVDPNLPRNTWPKGMVIATYPGKDGIVRVVDIRIAKSGHIHRRPVSRLCVLDVLPKEVEDKTEDDV